MRHFLHLAMVGIVCCGAVGCDTSPPPAASAAVPNGNASDADSDAGQATASPLESTAASDPSEAQGTDGEVAASEADQDSERSQGSVEGAQRPGNAPRKTVALQVEESDVGGRSQSRSFTFDDLQFEMETDGAYERNMLTEKVEQMFGTPIRIRGFILPTTQQHGLEQFVLVRDNQECCFGPGAALYDCIVVDMVPGKTANFSVRPVTVEGVFGYDEVPGFPELGPRPLAIYHLQASDVRN